MIIILLPQVRMKPGKPLTFAEIVTESGESTKVDKILAFGLPGNPVSCLVCFHLFVVPTIRHVAGWENPYPLRLLKVLKNLSHITLVSNLLIKGRVTA